MSELSKIVAAHPLQKYKPYNAIRFARFNGDNIPLYRVLDDPRDLGAKEALKLAMEKCGGHCFHCGEWMRAQPLSYDVTRDHMLAKSKGGRDYLHNLVFCCGPCNRGKASLEVVEFKPDSGTKYLRALSDHLTKCIEQLAKQK